MSTYQYFDRVRRSRFVRNVIIVASGSAGAQIIAMIFAPAVTRLYGPEVLGLLGIFGALVAVFTPVSVFSYPIAIILPKEDSDAKKIVQLSVYISICSTLLLSFVFMLSGERLLALLRAEEIAAFLLFVPVVILFSSWGNIAQQWLIRKEEFHITAKVTLTQALVSNSVKIAIGCFYPVAAMLIVVAAVGNFFRMILLYSGCKKVSKGKVSGSEHVQSSLFELAKRYYDFPLYRAPQVFISALSLNLPVLMLAAFFGPSSAGFYAICNRVLGLPSQLVGKSVGDVFYPRITKAAHKGENLAHVLVKVTLGLVAVGFLPFILIAAFGPWLFEVAFGSEWIFAGEYARWLALFFFFNYINKPSVAAVPVLGIQSGFLVYELFSTSGKVIGLSIGLFFYNSDIVAVALFSVFGAVAYFTMILWIIYSASKGKRHAETG